MYDLQSVAALLKRLLISENPLKQEKLCYLRNTMGL